VTSRYHSFDLCRKKVTTETDLTKTWQELEQKVESQNKEISSLLQSMRQEREEIKQESKQRQQELSSAVLRMENALSRLKASGCSLFS